MTDMDELADTFDRFDLGSGRPCWSSEMLDGLLRHMTVEQGRPMIEVIRALDRALDRQRVPLNEASANFIRDVSTIGFVLHGPWWQEADWLWALKDGPSGPSPARAYLLVRNLPPDHAPATVRASILLALSGTAWLSEAAVALEDESDSDDALAGATPSTAPAQAQV